MSRFVPVIAWATIATVFGLMLAWTWGTWPNAYVDFGRELYVPWRLSEGEVLYRDIAWFNGPLSAYRNALLFLLFGPGLVVLVFANLVDVALLVGVLYWLLRRVADRVAAFIGCGVFGVVFAFNQIDAIGNDNYLTPYSHELTQGVVLALVAILAFAALRDRPRRAAATSGALLGLVALTKAEPFLAGTGGLLCALLLDAQARRTSGAEVARRIGIFLTTMAVPVLIAFALLALALPPAEALRGTLGAWPVLFAGGVSSQYFYRVTLGLVGIADNLTSLLVWLIAWALAAGAITLVSLRVGPRRDATAPASELDGSPSYTAGGTPSCTAAGSPHFTAAGSLYYAAAGAASFVVVFYLGVWQETVWPDLLRPLPIVAGVLAAAAVVQALRMRDEPGERVTTAALLVFGTLLLAKVVLRVRLDQYGFALAMPATLLIVAAGVTWLPGWIGHRGGDARLARSAVLGVVGAVVLSLLPIIGARVRARDIPVGTGRDTFLADAITAPALNQTLKALGDRNPDATLAVLPEGVMLNYLSRRVNPTGHLNFMPPELLIFGEDSILAAFQAHPPDLIALTHKDTREYGVGFFGRGYGRILYRWVTTHYQPVERFGDPPLAPDSRFGVVLLERRRAGH